MTFPSSIVQAQQVAQQIKVDALDLPPAVLGHRDGPFARLDEGDVAPTLPADRPPPRFGSARTP
jgi:hypothetical protein